MDLDDLLYCLTNIVRMRATTKVDGNWVLAGSYVNDWRRARKEFPIFCEISDSKSCRHDDESQGLKCAIGKQGECQRERHTFV